MDRIEVNLREHISTVVDEDPANLPDHLLLKVDEAIRRKAKKNASIDPEEQKTISSKLLYADLRHLGDIIHSKVCWSKFEDTFSNRDTFLKKMDQLCELRNTICHRRPLEEVTKLEGQAAIKWFDSLLKGN